MRKLVLSLITFSAVLTFPLPTKAQIGYGAAVAAGSGEVFVGESRNEASPGYVYIYSETAGWSETARLSGSEATDADGFGSSIAIDGNRLIVGAAGRGIAYVFERSAGTWVEAAVLRPDDASSDHRFGNGVALRGNVAIVGAPAHDDGRGAAYVFSLVGGGWRSTALLSGEETGERFGTSVAMDADWAIVGAPALKMDFFLAGYMPRSPSGSAYVFKRDGDHFGERSRLSPKAGERGGAGFVVALRGNEALVGAPGANRFLGAVFQYVYSNERWTQMPGLEPYDRMPGAYFGSAVTFDDDEAFIGSPGAFGRTGRLYHFTRESLVDWTGANRTGTGGLGQFAIFAASVASHGDVVVVGSPGNDFGAGTAMIMRRGFDGWDRTTLRSPVRGLKAITGEPVPCENGKAGIFLCENIDLVSFLPVHEMGGGRGVSVADIWGWTDPETDRDYVVLGMRDGTTFVDVTDPENPLWVGKMPRTDIANSSVWRDVKVHGNHAFSVADNAGAHGVQIFDLTRLRKFDGTPRIYTEDTRYTEVNSVHNFAVNPDSYFGYAVGSSGGGETCGGGLHMINIEDPREPVFAGCFADIGTGSGGTGSAHDAQCVIYQGPDERYQGHEICFGSNETALSIADVTDKRKPARISRGSYPNLAYSHQGWVTDDHRYFYMNDELDEFTGIVSGTRTLIFDIQELDDPILVGEYQTDNAATDHNLFIRGDLMYQSNYRSGLRVVDINNREQPKAHGYFDTVPWGSDFGMGDIIGGAIGSWSNYPFFDSGIVAVSSGREGLFLLRVRQP